jgi:hypothetical protein
MRIIHGVFTTVLLAGLLTAGCADESEGERTQATYSCCPDEEMTAVYRPGQTMTLHWSVDPPPGPVVRPPGVELRAELRGPSGSVPDLKAGGRTAGVFTATPVRPTGDPDEKPVSVIAIGPDAGPGYYSLVTTIAHDDGQVEGESVIRIEAP